MGLLLAMLALTLPGCRWATSFLEANRSENTRLADLADEAEQRGDFSTAAGLWERAIESDPHNSELHQRLAAAHWKSGNTRMAMRHLHEAVAAGPADADGFAGLAALAWEMDDLDLAEELAQQAVHRDAAHVDALLLKARIAGRRGDLPVAAAEYYHVLQVAPNQPEARLRLAEHQVEQGQPDQAAALLRGLCHCTETSTEHKSQARWNLGVVYGRDGRWKDAAREFRLALIDMKHPTADHWYQLAWAAHQAKDDRSAIRVLRQGAQRHPEHKPMQRLLAELTRGNPIARGTRVASASDSGLH